MPVFSSSYSLSVQLWLFNAYHIIKKKYLGSSSSTNLSLMLQRATVISSTLKYFILPGDWSAFSFDINISSCRIALSSDCNTGCFLALCCLLTVWKCQACERIIWGNLFLCISIHFILIHFCFGFSPFYLVVVVFLRFTIIYYTLWIQRLLIFFIGKVMWSLFCEPVPSVCGRKSDQGQILCFRK